MDSLGEDIPRTTAVMKNMVESMLYTTREQIKMLRNAEDHLYFFQQQLEGKDPEEEL